MQISSMNNRYQAGVNLVELMVGIAVALVLLAGVIATVVNTSLSGSENLKAVKLNTQARYAMDFIHRELQRAGYVDAWDSDDDGDADNDGPSPNGTVAVDDLDTAAIAAFGQITLANFDGSACDTSSATEDACTCIFYSYDRPDGAGDDDGDGVQDANEQFGIQFNSDLGAIRVTTTATGTNCAADYNWERITDGEITVTALTFQLEIDNFTRYEVDPSDPQRPGTGLAGSLPYKLPEEACASGNRCLDRRKINIALSAQLTSDNQVRAQIFDEVKIRNDWYRAMP